MTCDVIIFPTEVRKKNSEISQTSILPRPEIREIVPLVERWSLAIGRALGIREALKTLQNQLLFLP